MSYAQIYSHGHHNTTQVNMIYITQDTAYQLYALTITCCNTTDL